MKRTASTALMQCVIFSLQEEHGAIRYAVGGSSDVKCRRITAVLQLVGDPDCRHTGNSAG